jgi:hypothetical protein
VLSAEAQHTAFSTPVQLQDSLATAFHDSRARRSDPGRLAVTDSRLVAFGEHDRDAEPIWSAGYEDLLAASAHNLDLKHALLRVASSLDGGDTGPYGEAPISRIVLNTDRGTFAVALDAASARRVLGEIRWRRPDISLPLTWEERHSAVRLRAAIQVTWLLVFLTLAVLSIVGVLPSTGG